MYWFIRHENQHFVSHLQNSASLRVPMCEHHHAAKHILCSQCDCWWRYRALSMVRKRHVPGVANVNRGVGCPSAASHRLCVGSLFMLLLSNLFPFVNMNVAGLPVKLHYWKFPACFFLRTTPPRHLFPVVCATGSRVLSDNLLLLVNRAELPVRLKEQLARCFFNSKPGEWRRFSSRVCWSFR